MARRQPCLLNPEPQSQGCLRPEAPLPSTGLTPGPALPGARHSLAAQGCGQWHHLQGDTGCCSLVALVEDLGPHWWPGTVRGINWSSGLCWDLRLPRALWSLQLVDGNPECGCHQGQGPLGPPPGHAWLLSRTATWGRVHVHRPGPGQVQHHLHGQVEPGVLPQAVPPVPPTRTVVVPARGSAQLRLQHVEEGPVCQHRAAGLRRAGRGLGPDEGDRGGRGEAAERARGVLSPCRAQWHRADLRGARSPLQALAREWGGHRREGVGCGDPWLSTRLPRCPSWSASSPAPTGLWASTAWTCVTVTAGGSRWLWTSTPMMLGQTAASPSRPPTSRPSHRTR